MHSVYLTYSGRNCEAVLQVMEALIRNGYALMCECMLPYGADPEAQAHRFICEADAVVAVITEDAVDCPYMARDLAWAKEAGRRILFVGVGDVQWAEDCRISDFPTPEEIGGFEERLREMMKEESP